MRHDTSTWLPLLLVLLTMVSIVQHAAAATSVDLQWAKKAGGTSSDQSQAVAIASDGSAYVTGCFQGTATFGVGVSLTSAGGDDIFLAKYASNGTLSWAKKAGGTSYEQGNGVAVTSDGSAYVTGFF